MILFNCAKIVDKLYMWKVFKKMQRIRMFCVYVAVDIMCTWTWFFGGKI